MRRIAAVAGCLFACTMFGCVDNRISFFFRGNIKPSTTCTFAAGGSDFLFSGTLDLFYTSNYYFAADVTNKLSTATSSTISISAIKWKLSIPSPFSLFLSCGQMLATLAGSATGYASCANATVNGVYQKYFLSGVTIPVAAILSGGSSTAVTMTLMGSEISSYIYNTLKTGASGVAAYFTSRDSTLPIFLEIEVLGQTLGGTNVTTGTFLFPLTICYGCLRSQPNGANCSNGTSDTGAALLTKPCAIGQDILVDCRYACGQSGDCKTNETCAAGACFCGANAGCTNGNSCSGSSCNCGGGTLCSGTKTCTTTTTSGVTTTACQ